MTKTQVLIGLLMMWFIYTMFLNIFSFAVGAPSFFEEDPKICDLQVKNVIGLGDAESCESVSKLRLLLGFGNYADIPQPITWIISFALVIIMMYFVYEALMPTK